VAETVTAAVRVPAHDRVVVDGYAVRAAATSGGDDDSESQVVLPVVDVDEADPDARTGEGTDGDRAVPVEAGDAVPAGTDAVVRAGAVRRVGTGDGRTLVEVSKPAPGTGIVRAGGDVVAGQTLFDRGHELCASDVGLLKAAGVDRVPVARRPSVGVVPTGDELVQGNPGPGETVETNGLVLSSLIDQWGGVATYRNVVPDDDAALGAALTRETASDVIVLVGGTGSGASDHTVATVASAGELLVHGVAMQPGGSVALGVVRERPVVVLPGAPAACTVAAVQFLRPVLRRVVGRPTATDVERATSDGPSRPATPADAGTPADESGPDRRVGLPWVPSVRARLAGRVDSDPGVRTFASVRLRRGPPREAAPVGDPAGGESNGSAGARATGVADDHTDDPDHDYVAVPARRAHGTLRSSVALSDGWVTVPESTSGLDAGASVVVERWDSPR
jgi:molybdopterin molybdotransferase